MSTENHSAVRQALLAAGFIVLPGQEDAFDALRAGLLESLVPQGALQETLFLRILESSWNLHRCRLAAAALYAQSGDPTIDPLLLDDDKKQERIRKCAREYESSLAKNLKELGRIQTDARFRLEAQTPDQAVSEVCEVQKVVAAVSRQRKAQSRPLQNEPNPDDDAEAFALLDRLTRPSPPQQSDVQLPEAA